MAQSATQGGKVFPRLLKRAAAQQTKDIAVGIFATARYAAGRVTNRPGHTRSKPVEVAKVAAAHEYGQGVPMRPFLRIALPDIDATAKRLAAKAVKANQGVMPDLALGLIGEMAVGKVKESITKLDKPPNAPSTIEVKGSSNPLIDTGFMRSVVDYEIRDAPGN